MKFILFVTLALGIKGQPKSETCGVRQLESCLNQTTGVHSEKKLGGLTGSLTNQVLACRKFYKGMECVETFYKACQNSSQRTSIENQIKGAKRAMMKLCLTKETNQENYFTCYQDLKSEISRCIKPLRNIRHLHSHYDVRNSMTELCCARNKTQECVAEVTRKTCNEKAVKFAHQIFLVATSSSDDSCSAVKEDDCIIRTTEEEFSRTMTPVLQSSTVSVSFVTCMSLTFLSCWFPTC
ncbi:uncharacterized protein LOC143256450 [Tachypleus tridentatus]|uniref:uncharacterized protein LOC143256450 n=1 Tax=Tachypleus tridentatus TaxID=6853 RepID=UPI003FD1EF61